jgi:hypothetical protein
MNNDITTQYVKVTKLRDCDDPFKANHIAPGYERTGILLEPPKVGECFWVGSGWRTSVVQEIIDEKTFRTYNSIYTWEIIPPSDGSN